MLSPLETALTGQPFRRLYCRMLDELAQEWSLSRTEAEGMFLLSCDKTLDTARDICAYRHLKPGIVSLHVERLVAEGYLTRSPVPGDRRKCRLLCTEKAWPVIRRGRQYQADFTARLTEGLSPADLAVCQRCLAALDQNLTALSQGLPEKENDT